MFRSNSSLRILNLPSGVSAKNVERIMLLAMWGRYWEQKNKKKVEAACMGKPTYPVTAELCQAGVDFWEKHLEEEKMLSELIGRLSSFEKFSKSSEDFHKKCILQLEEFSQAGDFTKIEALVTNNKLNLEEGNFGEADFKSTLAKIFHLFSEKLKREQQDPQGDFLCRELLARGFNNFSHPAVQIKAEHIVLPLGGAGGLNLMLSVLDEQDPEGCVLLPIPFYALHAGSKKTEFIDTTQNLGYRLNLEDLERKIKEMQKEGKRIKALLLCNPSNPMGIVFTRQERESLVSLAKKSGIRIMVDEAYTDFVFKNEPCLADLQASENEALRFSQPSPMINAIEAEGEGQDPFQDCDFLRLGTKGQSTAPERMGALIVFNPGLREFIIKKNKECGIPPLSLQKGYAAGVGTSQDFFHINYGQKAVSEVERNPMSAFYQAPVEYLQKKLKLLGMNVLDKVDGAFYVNAKLKFLIGFQITEEQSELLKTVGIELIDRRLDTDESITYLLLLFYNILIAPLSYYGLAPEEGLFRITCSGSQSSQDKILAVFKELKQLVEGGKPDTHIAEGKLLKEIDVSEKTEALDSELIAVNPDDVVEPRGGIYYPSTFFAAKMREYWQGYLRKSQVASRLEKKYQTALAEHVKKLLRDNLTEIIRTISSSDPEPAVVKNLENLLNIFLSDTMPTLDESDLALWEQGLEDRKKLIYANLRYHVEKIKEEPLNPSEPAFEAGSLEGSNILIERIIDSLYKSLAQHDPDAVSRYFLFWYWRNVEAYHASHFSSHRQTILDLDGAMDYGDPRGDLEHRLKVSDALNGSSDSKGKHLKEDDILFTHANPDAIFKSAFDAVCDLRDIESFATSNPLVDMDKKYAILVRNSSEPLGQGINEDEIEATIGKLKNFIADPRVFIVIDESFIERCLYGKFRLEEHSIWVRLLNEGIDTRRLVVVRSSKGIFSPENDAISIIGSTNSELMSTLLSINIKMTGHAPRSLQQAYALSLEAFIKSYALSAEKRLADRRALSILSALRTHISKPSPLVSLAPQRSPTPNAEELCIPSALTRSSSFESRIPELVPRTPILVPSLLGSAAGISSPALFIAPPRTPTPMPSTYAGSPKPLLFNGAQKPSLGTVSPEPWKSASKLEKYWGAKRFPGLVH